MAMVLDARAAGVAHQGRWLSAGRRTCSIASAPVSRLRAYASAQLPTARQVVYRAPRVALTGSWASRASAYRHSAPLRVALVDPPSDTAPDAAPASVPTYGNAVLFQGFGWDSSAKGDWYNIVKSKIEELQSAGCSHIWLPPPSASVSPQGYMPTQWYQLDTAYGSKEELAALNAALLQVGITPIADIVINHRSAEKKKDGKYNNFQDYGEHDGARIDWDQWAIARTDKEYGGQGHPDTGADFWAAPDLDHLNARVQAAIVEWLNWMKREVGFDGWRFDFTKGYGPEFVGKYVEETIGQDKFHVGELWVDMNWVDGRLDPNQDGPRQAICDWVNGTQKRCTAFDFPTKGILQEACKNTEYWRLRDREGKPSGLIGWWPGRAVTFIDNHDTGSSQAHWPFPGDKVATGYAYILTHPGIPCIFWEHFFDWGDELKKTITDLLDLRKRNSLHSKSGVKILAADADFYFAIIDDRVAVKLGPRYDMGNLVPREEEGWRLASSGVDFAIWEKK